MKFNVKLITLLSLLVLVSSFKLKSKKYNIEIIQHGVVVPITGNTVILDKEVFQLRVTLKNIHGIYMSSSFDRGYFDTKETEPIKDFKYIGSKCRAEPSFNSDKEFGIDTESLSFLFYDKTMDWHRFDKGVLVKGKKVIGLKTIQQVYIDDTKETILLKDLTQDIFLFFFATKKVENTEKELGRLKLQIKWK